MQQFADPAGQAWLQLWVGLFAKQGGTSRLAGYVRDDEHRHEPVQHGRAQAGPEAARLRGGQPGQAEVEAGEGEWEEGQAETVTVFDRASLALLLTELPQYFATVRNLHRISLDDYQMFRRIGCVIAPEETTWVQFRGQIPVYPAFLAAIHLGKYWRHPSWEGKEAERDKFASIHIFKRVRFAGAYVKWGDLTYEWMHIATNTETGKGGGEAAFIGVDRATAKMRVLAQPTTTPQRLRYGTVSHTHIGIPKWVRENYADTSCKENIHDWAGAILQMAISEWRSADRGWQVHLTDTPEHGPPVVMRLCIPERAAKDFFRDREAPEQGRLRPIFHLVAEHERQLGDNRHTTVRQHYRGNRMFTWNGYRTLITVPGHHHNRLSTLDIDSIREGEEPPDERTVDMPELGRILARHIRRASPLHSYRRGW